MGEVAERVAAMVVMVAMGTVVVAAAARAMAVGSPAQLEAWTALAMAGMAVAAVMAPIHTELTLAAPGSNERSSVSDAA